MAPRLFFVRQVGRLAAAALAGDLAAGERAGRGADDGAGGAIAAAIDRSSDQGAGGAADDESDRSVGLRQRSRPCESRQVLP